MTSMRPYGWVTGSRCCPKAGGWSSTIPPATLLGSPANEFVAEFVGADRGIKLLGVTRIPSALRPAPDGGLDGVPSVPATGTLRDALAALLDGGTDWVTVRDPDGSVLGILTIADIHATASVTI